MPFPTMTVTQQFTLTLNPTDKKGKPAPVDPTDPPTWGSSNDAVAQVVPAADGLSALVVAQGVGDYTISVSADADLSANISLIIGSDTGTVTAGQATSVGLVAGPVEEQP